MKRKIFLLTEIILIAVSLSAFILSIYARILGSHKFDLLDYQLSNLQIQYNCLGGGVIRRKKFQKN